MKSKNRKEWLVVATPFALIGSCLALVIIPWMVRFNLMSWSLTIFCWITSVLWIIVLTWSLYHLAFQVASLIRKPGDAVKPDYRREVSFAVLYVTCDDFQINAFQSCLNQDYQGTYRVLIGDDSREEEYIRQVNQAAQGQAGVTVVRRPDRSGFKAGNLNNLIASSSEDWYVIVDADQILPTSYLSTFATIAASQPNTVGFIQGGHQADHFLLANTEDSEERMMGPTKFQQALGIEIQLFYNHDLACRNKYGFVPFLGHGGAARRETWNKTSGFPLLVSEDYAFSLAAAVESRFGVYSDSLVSWESFPQDFGAFLVRLRKFAGGSAELFKASLTRKFINSGAHQVEKIDFLLLLLWYPLMPLVVANGFLSAYVCHCLWELRISALHPALPAVFVAMFLLPVPPLLAVTGSLAQAIRFWAWSTAVYGACMPIASWHFVIHFFQKPSFERTPKRGSRSPSFVRAGIGTAALGVLAIVLAWIWWSPFSPVLLAHGVAFISFLLYGWLNEAGLRGLLSRAIIWAPSGLLLWALYLMWEWSRI